METNLVLIFKCPKSKMVWHKTRCLKNGISAYIFVLFMCQFLNVILKFRNWANTRNCNVTIPTEIPEKFEDFFKEIDPTQQICLCYMLVGRDHPQNTNCFKQYWAVWKNIFCRTKPSSKLQTCLKNLEFF